MIYFDNAATTFPKPLSVLRRTMACMREECGNPGRGSHRMAMRASEVLYSCRERAADFFGASEAERVVFTMNTTHALNLAMKSVLRPGDHVLTGDMEHNSVVRPLAAMEEVSRDVFCVRATPDRMLAEIGRLVRPNTRAIVCAHVPNTANIALPVERIGRFCRARGIVLILDGAQSAGHLPIDIERMHVDILCVPGHKGLYGTQGCGMMILGKHAPCGKTLMEGGSGSRSLDTAMPDELPEHFEAGTLPTPAIAGLDAGIGWVQGVGTEAIHALECRLWKRMYADLSAMPGVRIAEDTPGAILMFTVAGHSPSAIAEALDQRGICVRAGYHCAPAGHRALGTEHDGAVRVSFGALNTEREVTAFSDAMWRILRGR